MSTEPTNDPIGRFAVLLERATAEGIINANAMVLSTCSAEGRPSSREVLLKQFDESGFVFYTNLESQKAMEIRDNPFVSLLFYWPELGRQVRIEGAASPVTSAEADAYFDTRPRMAKIGAWASKQSRPLKNRARLMARAARFEARFLGRKVPRPPHWSGFRVAPERIEFWTAAPFRLHQRTVFEKSIQGWKVTLLYP